MADDVYIASLYYNEASAKNVWYVWMLASTGMYLEYY